MTIVWDRAELQKFPIQRNNKGKEFWYPDINIVMASGPAKLEFWSEVKGKRKGEVTEVKYNEPLRHHSLGDAFGATSGDPAGKIKRASSIPPPPPGNVELE